MRRDKYISLRPLLIIVAVILAYRLLYIQLFMSLERQGVAAPSLLNLPLMLFVGVAAFFVVRYMNLNLPYGRYSVLRFSCELLYLIISSAILAIALNFSQIIQGRFTELVNYGDIGIVFLGVLLLNTVVLYIINLVFFYRERQRRALDEQIAAKNHATYQYNQLKRQLDPHFLFNSLSVLDSLIEIDPTRAHNFITKLSQVYRYLLSGQERTKIELYQEIKFVESYIELMQERFGDSVKYTHVIATDKHDKRLVIPFSLQILVENAIKHNAISAAAPLEIHIYIDQDFVVVVNNIQPKIGMEPVSTGVGLRYITVRYAEFSDKQVEVDSDNGFFTVKIPLLSDKKEQSDENFDN